MKHYNTNSLKTNWISLLTCLLILYIYNNYMYKFSNICVILYKLFSKLNLSRNLVFTCGDILLELDWTLADFIQFEDYGTDVLYSSYTFDLYLYSSTNSALIYVGGSIFTLEPILRARFGNFRPFRRAHVSPLRLTGALKVTNRS